MTRQGVVDLFAGPGGWDSGLAMLGEHDVVGVEWDTAACQTASAAGHKRVQADVAGLDPLTAGGGADGLIASPPCQGFSKAGGGRGALDSTLLLQGVIALGQGNDPREALHKRMADDRSVLALEPLRWALAIRPRWCAWEQVPSVLPLWEACADVLAQNGYSTWTGMLSAEQFGVPQTRNRAILAARLDGDALAPEPILSRYHVRSPARLDPGMPRWVSMAEALGWGMTHRPYPTVAAGTSAGGGTDPQAIGGSGARRLIDRERADGRWIDQPVTWALNPNAGLRNDRSLPRTIDAPSHTVAIGHNAAGWVWREHPLDPDLDELARLVGDREVNQSGTRFDLTWPANRPAPVIAGRDLVTMPGANANRYNGSTKSRNDGVRVTEAEAGVLQSFPVDYPWQGGKGDRFRQVGDAMPPLLAAHVLGPLVGAWEAGR